MGLVLGGISLCAERYVFKILWDMLYLNHIARYKELLGDCRYVIEKGSGRTFQRLAQSEPKTCRR